MENTLEIRDEFSIPEANVEGFLKAIAKLNKAAAKVGAQPVKTTFLREEIREVGTNDPAQLAWAEERGIDPETLRLRNIKYMIYKVEGEAPKFAGWTFVSVVEVTEFGNIIKKVPGMDLDASWQTNPMVCEHCRTNRARKAYYIVRHENGDEKSVGATCIKDFLGHSNPTAVATWFQYMHELQGFTEGGRGGPEYFDVVDVLAVALSCIRHDGFVSRKMAIEAPEGDRTPRATSSDVTYYFSPMPFDRKAREDWEAHQVKYAPSTGDKETAAAVKEWMLGLGTNPNRSDYENNVFIYASQGNVTGREFGIVTAAANSGARALDRLRIEKERQAAKSNEWLGKVEDRIEFKGLRCVRTKEIETAYGTSTLVLFEDAVGNMLKWFSSHTLTWFQNMGQPLEPGKIYDVKATIKAHEMYKERKQTSLSRCKLTEVIA